MITDDIFMEVRFMDNEGHCYGKIEESEFGENIYTFVPTDTNEIPNPMLEKANEVVKLLNDVKGEKDDE